MRRVIDDVMLDGDEHFFWSVMIPIIPCRFEKAFDVYTDTFYASRLKCVLVALMKSEGYPRNPDFPC